MANHFATPLLRADLPRWVKLGLEGSRLLSTNHVDHIELWMRWDEPEKLGRIGLHSVARASQRTDGEEETLLQGCNGGIAQQTNAHQSR